MRYEEYKTLTITDNFSIIDFISEGPKGHIPKRIIFEATELENVYNLAFGDLKENGDIDDYSISNNGDRNKILATVVTMVKLYTQKYPNRLISSLVAQRKEQGYTE